VKNSELLNNESFVKGTVAKTTLVWNDEKYRGYWRQRLQACLSWDDPEAVRNEILQVISELRSRL
jgi:hypothetical protein